MSGTLLQHIDNHIDGWRQNTALVDGNTRLTYEQLQTASYWVSERLQQSGVAQGSRIGLLMPRGAVIVVSMVGVMRSGCSYVPMDATQPAARLESILEQAGIEFVLVQSISDKLPDTIKQIVLPDVDFDALEKLAPQIGDIKHSSSVIDPGAEVYCIFTSGTTGKPKGVRISHSNVVRLFQVSQPLFDFSPNDRFCLFHSPCFDVSVWEIFACFYHGATLYIVPDATCRDTQEFHGFLERNAITVLNQTPSSFYQLDAVDRSLAKEGELALRHVIFAGEKLTPSKLSDWIVRHPLDQTALANMYGPTEITVYATFKQLLESDIEKPESNIGTGLSDLDLVLLDEGGNAIVGEGVGELLIVGPGVGFGYIGNEALNLERFIQFPYRNGESARAYRTGDQVQRLGSDELLYLGRKDRQVKVRGYRVELSEIEVALTQLDIIKDCIAVVRDIEDGDSRIVAFVVPSAEDGMSVDTAVLQSSLENMLPHYMIPSTIQVIAEMPLNRNHKADTGALIRLLDSNVAYLETQQDFANDVEQQLFEIWRGLLKTNKFNRLTQFEDVGGNSLLTVHLLVEVQARWGVSIRLRQLAEDFSIASIAAIVFNHLSSSESVSE